jgi:hypothetical protein
MSLLDDVREAIRMANVLERILVLYRIHAATRRGARDADEIAFARAVAKELETYEPSGRGT